MGKTLIVVVVLLIVALLVGSWFVGIRNQMVTKRETVNAAWSSVDIALQRRSDLIPNLVETVKGYAAQETTIFPEIAKASSALLGARTPTDTIPANTVFIFAPNGTFANGVVTFNIGALAGNTSVTRTVTVQVANAVAANVTSIINFCSVTIERASCRERE
jgi:hypothetical protein